MNIDELQTYIHGLSQVQIHHEPGCDTRNYSKALDDVKNHIQLLDGICLLLIFQETGDIAACSVWTSSKKATLLYAKNVEVTKAEELAYIQNLFKSVRTGQDAQKGLEIVIPACKAKIVSRATRLAQHFGLSKANLKEDTHNLWNFRNYNPYHQKIGPALVDDGLIEEGVPISQMLDRYTRAAASLNKESSVKFLRQFLNLSFVLSEEIQLEKILTRYQAGAIRKLGSYRRSLQLLSEVEEKMAARGISMNYQQIKPPGLREVSVFSGTLDCFNYRVTTGKTSYKTIPDLEAIQKVFPKAAAGTPTTGMKSIKVNQHAEVTIAIEMISRFSCAIKSFEIGVSKRCCVWCDEWLDCVKKAVNRQDFQVIRKGYHGKRPDGWAIPSTSMLPGTEDQIRAIILQKVDNILNAVEHRYRRSDSTEMEKISPAPKRRKENGGDKIECF